MRIISRKEVVGADIIRCFKKGRLIISPTDTVYGLLADAQNNDAVKNLTIFKNRPPGKPVSIFVSDFDMLSKYVEAEAKNLNVLRELLPGPFTIILPSKHLVSPLLESEKGTLGVRYPDYPFINQITAEYGKPLTATSANLSSHTPHYSVDTLLSSLPNSKKDLIDLVIDAGKLPRNKPSTVVDLTTPQIKIMRQGDILLKNIHSFISESPSETKRIAQYLVKKNIHRVSQEPLVYILIGNLGAGKTVFVKGIGEYLGVTEIVSPTFVIYYEYDIPQKDKNKAQKLIHADFYNISEIEEFDHLGMERYLKKGNIICIEWGEKAGAFIDVFKKKAKVFMIEMNHIDRGKREIKVRD